MISPKPAVPEHRQDGSGVHDELIRLLFSHVTSSSIASMLAGVVLLLALWPQPDPMMLIVWCLITLMLNVLRILLTRQFHADSEALLQSRLWHYKLSGITALIGCSWGLGALLFMQQSEFAYQVFIIFMVGGLAAGAVASYAPSLLASSAFVLPAVLIPGGWMFIQPNGVMSSIGIMSLLFSVIMLAVARQQRATLIENMGLRFEKEYLLDRLQVNDKLHERAQSLARLGHWHFVADTQSLVCSDEAIRILESTSDKGELKLASWFAHIHPDDRDAVRARFDLAMQQGSGLDCKYRLLFADGRIKWVHVLAEFSSHEGEASAQAEGMIQDVSAHKQTMEELRAARDAAEKADRAKSEFLANMSHEIRTPLHGILGMAENLKDGELSDSQRENIQLLIHSGDTLLGLINDILDFSKIEAGLMTLDESAFDPRELVRDVVRMFSGKARDKGIQLNADVSEEAALFVKADLVRVRQVLVNLIGNAIKFTEQGGVFVSLQEERLAEKVRLHFRVRDNGVGISPDKQATIFEKFSQAESSTTRKFGGTGIGLSICHDLIALMGGEIGVESQLGEGSQSIRYRLYGYAYA